MGSFAFGLERYAEFTEMIGQKSKEVEKAAWSIYLKASNDSARVGALRTILEALEIHRDIVQTRDVIERLEKIEEMAQNQKTQINANTRVVGLRSSSVAGLRK